MTAWTILRNIDPSVFRYFIVSYSTHPVAFPFVLRTLITLPTSTGLDGISTGSARSDASENSIPCRCPHSQLHLNPNTTNVLPRPRPLLRAHPARQTSKKMKTTQRSSSKNTIMAWNTTDWLDRQGLWDVLCIHFLPGTRTNNWLGHAHFISLFLFLFLFVTNNHLDGRLVYNLNILTQIETEIDNCISLTLWTCLHSGIFRDNRDSKHMR